MEKLSRYHFRLAYVLRHAPFCGFCKEIRCAINGAPSNRYSKFTVELGEVFAETAAALFHQPKALLRRACIGYLIPSLLMLVIIGEGARKVKPFSSVTDTDGCLKSQKLAALHDGMHCELDGCFCHPV
ncbi:MAG: hypothetical protein RR946_11090, partial [Clostridia bacterium]